ncbi:MAG: type II toxin-antitoxin system Phd/YefM family antitoxin [Actinomycetota bacterium]|nr:type II toxin-antitoxin system Phd/YefM family antitoxin [Actinomycetota bacterium]
MLVNVHEAKTNFSRLLDRVSRGEQIVIGRAGKPVAKLVPYSEASGPRSPGAWKGRVKITPDFDDLPAELTAAFLGERA